jgi:hypothetical protein
VAKFRYFGTRVTYENYIHKKLRPDCTPGILATIHLVQLGYIWHDVSVNTVSWIYKKIKERCNDIERENLFSKIKEKSSLIFYSEMKQEWTREQYISCCTRTERSGLA